MFFFHTSSSDLPSTKTCTNPDTITNNITIRHKKKRGFIPFYLKATTNNKNRKKLNGNSIKTSNGRGGSFCSSDRPATAEVPCKRSVTPARSSLLPSSVQLVRLFRELLEAQLAQLGISSVDLQQKLKWQRGGMKTFSSVPANFSAQEWAKNKIQSLTLSDRQQLFEKFNERTVFEAVSKVFN